MDSILVSLQKKASLDSEDEKLLPLNPSENLINAFSLLMAYLKETQKQHIDHFMPMDQWIWKKSWSWILKPRIIWN